MQNLRQSFYILSLIFLILSLAVTNASYEGWKQEPQSCKEKMFPITVGGDFDDFVNCTMHDKVNDIIIVAGYSESEFFVPT